MNDNVTPIRLEDHEANAPAVSPEELRLVDAMDTIVGRLREVQPIIDNELLGHTVGGVANMEALCHMLSFHAGWWDGFDKANPNLETVCTKLALIHSEVSEALEGARKGTQDSHLPHRSTVEVELADAVIRIFDLSGALGLNVAQAMLEKLAYNQTRKDHTREHRASAEGKKI